MKYKIIESRSRRYGGDEFVYDYHWRYKHEDKCERDKCLKFYHNEEMFSGPLHEPEHIFIRICNNILRVHVNWIRHLAELLIKENHQSNMFLEWKKIK